MKRLALKPLMVVESDCPMKVAKTVTARIATRPTFTLRKKPIMITAISTIRDTRAMLFINYNYNLLKKISLTKNVFPLVITITEGLI